MVGVRVSLCDGVCEVVALGVELKVDVNLNVAVEIGNDKGGEFTAVSVAVCGSAESEAAHSVVDTLAELPLDCLVDVPVCTALVCPDPGVVVAVITPGGGGGGGTGAPVVVAVLIPAFRVVVGVTAPGGGGGGGGGTGLAVVIGLEGFCVVEVSNDTGTSGTPTSTLALPLASVEKDDKTEPSLPIMSIAVFGIGEA